ncbi:hypothetical protein [uncultured Clostridium sp.]|uniref:hypothetical protein n=1 Tax=uncultured Clostridium sp. TaxID=59620 RepID=UPI0028ED3C0A|nr:hypothetical protein [uncultured Clostridium sp.]
MFEREDWKLFRNIETLCQKAGVRKDRIPMLVIKELVDNALDTFTPINYGLLAGNGFYIKDSGNGIEPNLLKDFFSINRPMITTKLLRLPTKGALGNGLRVAIGAVIATNGKIFISTRYKKYQIIPNDNNGSSEVIEIEDYEERGTKIEVYFGSVLPIKQVDLKWADLAYKFDGGEHFTCKTSAYWYTSEAFFELVNAYSEDIYSLCLYFEGINKNKAKDISKHFDNIPAKEMSFEDSEELLRLLRYDTRPIKHKKLGYCGDQDGIYGQYIKKASILTMSSVKGNFDAEIPYIVEGWIIFQERQHVEVLVNKTPITGEMETWMSKNELCIAGCGLMHGFKSKPAQVILNVITPYMPITSDGKEPNLKMFKSEISDVLNKANRKAKKAFMLENSNNAKNEREIIFNNMESAIDKAGGFGQYKFSQRQLYYAIRPYVMNALEKQSDYNYFCRLLTEYENEYGEIYNLYRDPRGTLYHPHLKHEIPLGTIAVQNYERPKWTFNKILYCEKEGFFPILKDAKFPERYDCALLSSKGYASRAVKDLFDLLGETDEEILFFCIHDADSAGTMIYETLQESTISRKARKVKVIDLGLNPWEALDMDLEVETFESKSRRPVANYVKERYWRGEDETDYEEWLQKNRIELNAMSTPQFLEWIEEKISIYDNGKVIPSDEVLIDNLITNVEDIIKEEVKNKILKEAGYDNIVQQEFENNQYLIKQELSRLREKVEDSLYEESEDLWTEPIKNIARKLINI